MRGILAIVFFTLSFNLLAQVDSIELNKRWLLGGNGQIYLEKIGENTGRLIAIVEPQFGYFFTNSWLVGLRVPMSFKSNEYQLAVQPFVRFYVPLKGHVLPFIEANVGYDWRVIVSVTNNPNNQENSWVFGARGGAAFFINQHVSIDIFGYYTGMNSIFRNGETGYVGDPLYKQFFGIGAGFQVYL